MNISSNIIVDTNKEIIDRQIKTTKAVLFLLKLKTNPKYETMNSTVRKKPTILEFVLLDEKRLSKLTKAHPIYDRTVKINQMNFKQIVFKQIPPSNVFFR